MNGDLRSASYEELLDFVFDHETAEEVSEKWYWHLPYEVELEPRQAIAFITRLCNSAATLVGQYTSPQIDEGLNYVFGAGGMYQFFEQLWNAAIPGPERRACIVAIPKLYADIFEREADGHADIAFMLWDSIAYDYTCGNRDPATNAEDARVQDAMFEALTSMLHSGHPRTLFGALHGLGHLHHRDGNRAIRAWLSSARDLSADLQRYAADVLEDDIQ